ncbi:MAG: hypothetical protein AAGJ32_06500 [Pseudomonadota bacterium]
MTKTIAFASAITAMLVFAPATAQATAITVGYSDAFEEKLSDEFGEREGERLAEYVTDRLENAFAKEGVEVDRVDVTINDAKPNRPTQQQLSAEPSLDFARSISIGGADFSAIAYDASGAVIAEVEYDWFENDIREVIGNGTWTDARRASRQFARRMARSLEAQ